MKLFKYKSLKVFDHVLDIILLERLYCAPYNQLNDPCEGMFLHNQSGFFMDVKEQPIFINHKTKEYKTIKELSRSGATQIKVCSLSSLLSDVQLWSYYADGHKGVAIEIDFSNKETDAKKVNYINTLPEGSIGTLLSEGSKLENILSSKTIHWEHESEYRIIQDAYYYLITGRISGIYVGINTSTEHKDLLNKVVPSSIPLFYTKLNPDTLEIEKGKIWGKCEEIGAGLEI